MTAFISSASFLMNSLYVLISFSSNQLSSERMESFQEIWDVSLIFSNFFSLRRYQQGGTSLIKDLSKRPHKIPHKTPEFIEQEIIRHKKSKPYLDAKRLKRDFDIPCSHGAIHRIMKQNGLIGQPKARRDVASIRP
jgi:hypothetical protein